MLSDAGVDVEVQPASIDEASIKARFADAAAAAVALAQAKALEVSARRPGDWVIGSDSIVSVEGRTFDKPGSREQAAEHLHFFSGKAMLLTSAVALARSGEVDWSHGETAELRVRPLSEQFIQAYLEREWPAVGFCVGVFRMEGPGIQLFERVSGSHWTILGMPLIPLLNALRAGGLLPS